MAQLFAEAPRRPVRLYLETGLYDNFPSGSAPIDEVALDEENTAGNRHFRDVLVAKGYEVIYRETPTAHDWLHWRATLADALIALLQPAR